MDTADVATAEPVVEEPTGGGAPADRWDRAAPIAFGLLVAFAVPYVLFGVGEFHWFFRDDWDFIAGREASNLGDLFRDHNSHLSTVPVLAFRALWAVFGIRTYLPYQASTLLLHLGACTLLWVLMRRAGVRPWLATAAAGLFVLFGPGHQNILWGFQIGFTGALMWGLLQLVLLDHDGPLNRRDSFGLAAGALSVLSAGVGVAMAVVTGMAALGRRGWRVAAFHTAPLAALYLLWYVLEDPEVGSEFGRPSVEMLVDWVWATVTGTFAALGHFSPVARAMGLVLVAGGVLAFARSDAAGRRKLATPAAMLVGSVLMAGLTGNGRWILGTDFARSSRYLHIGAALTLPAIAVGAEHLARRWKPAFPALLALLLVPIPFNAGEFDYGIFGTQYMESRKQVFLNIVRLPEAREVPRDIQPIPDVFGGATLGFLLDAADNGKLDPADGPLDPEFENELRLRLALAQRRGPAPLECETVTGVYRGTPPRGTVFAVFEDLIANTIDDGHPSSRNVRFSQGAGNTLTVELSVTLQLRPARQAETWRLCSSTP